MEFLNEIKDYKFDGYDEEAITSTKENIKELLEDSDIVWNEWKRDGLSEDKKFVVDFNFYSSDKDGVLHFTKILQKNHFEVEVKTKRTLLFFKGYEVKASINDYWNLKKLNEIIELLGLFSRKYNALIEGYGAFTNISSKEQ